MNQDTFILLYMLVALVMAISVSALFASEKNYPRNLLRDVVDTAFKGLIAILFGASWPIIVPVIVVGLAGKFIFAILNRVRWQLSE